MTDKELADKVIARTSKYNQDNRGTIVIKQGERKHIKGTTLKHLRIEKCVLLNGMTQLLSFNPDSTLTQMHNQRYLETAQLVGNGYTINVCYDTSSGVIEVSGTGVGEVTFSFK